MVSFAQRHLAVLTLEVTVLDRAVPLAVTSHILNRQDGLDECRTSFVDKGAVDPRKAERFTGQVLQPVEHFGGDNRALLGYRCANSGMTLAVGTDHQIETDNEYDLLTEVEEDHSKYIYRDPRPL